MSTGERSECEQRHYDRRLPTGESCPCDRDESESERALTRDDVLVDHLPQLARKLDAGRSTSAHDKAQQLPPLLLLRTGQRSLLQIVHHAPPDRLGVLHRLELETVFEAGDAVSVVDGSAGDHELVVGQVEVFFVARAGDFEEALGKVDVDGAASASECARVSANESASYEQTEPARSLDCAPPESGLRSFTHRPYKK